MTAIAWVLNFDSDDELAIGAGYTPSAEMRARCAVLAKTCTLVRAGDTILDEDAKAPDFTGRAWCPTPRALRMIARAGALVPEAPPVEILARVNHRRFSAELGQTLPGARFVTTTGEALETIEGGTHERWLLKRPFGFAGRGRLRITRGKITSHERAWMDASRDGLQVEPWMERTGDYAIHGMVARDGTFALGAPTSQRVDDHGAWVATEIARDLSNEERDALVAQAELGARSLVKQAYFGPFGVDAYRYRVRTVEESGPKHGYGGGFNARSEINARYTMGWPIGMVSQ